MFVAFGFRVYNDALRLCMQKQRKNLPIDRGCDGKIGHHLSSVQE